VIFSADQHLDALYNISIGYPANCPQNEPDLILGNFPSEVHFHIERHDASTLPSSAEDLAAWCNQRLKEKERVLEEFASKKRFTEEAVSPDPGPVLLMRLTMCYWFVFVVGISWVLMSSSVAFWLAVIQVAFYIYMGHFYGGFELYHADNLNNHFNKKKKPV
jgi:lysocardiolipin and lysophospholipid acyltransferase